MKSWSTSRPPRSERPSRNVWSDLRPCVKRLPRAENGKRDSGCRVVRGTQDDLVPALPGLPKFTPWRPREGRAFRRFPMNVATARTIPMTGAVTLACEIRNAEVPPSLLP